MLNKKQLNDEVLEKVTGGDDWGDEKSKYLPSTHGIHVGMDFAKDVLNRDVYIVRDLDREDFYWGTLTSVDDYGYITLHVKGCNDYIRCDKSCINTYKSFKKYYYTMFLYSNS